MHGNGLNPADMNFSLAKFRLVMFGIVFLLIPSSLIAQNDDQLAPPFKVGETAVYEAKFSRALVPPLTVGDLFFTVMEAPQNSGSRFVIKGEAQSRGIVKLFGRKVSIRVESTVADGKFRIVKTVKHDDQGDRVRDSEAFFDYKAKKVFYEERDPKDPARRPYQLAASIPETAHDVLSGIYILRMMPLAVGKTFNLTVSDSGLVFTIPVKVTGRERQKDVENKVWAWRIEPEIFGDKRPFPGKGKLTIWVTDDARRLPVRALLNLDIGKIDVRIKKYNPVPG
jgi:hypothetical protein